MLELAQEHTKKQLELENAEKARVAAAIAETPVRDMSLSGHATNDIHLIQTTVMNKLSDLLNLLCLRPLLLAGNVGLIPESDAVLRAIEILLGKDQEVKQTVLKRFLLWEGEFKYIPCKLYL
jgi:hypothetical protein